MPASLPFAELVDAISMYQLSLLSSQKPLNRDTKMLTVKNFLRNQIDMLIWFIPMLVFQFTCNLSCFMSCLYTSMSHWVRQLYFYWYSFSILTNVYNCSSSWCVTLGYPPRLYIYVIFWMLNVKHNLVNSLTLNSLCKSIVSKAHNSTNFWLCFLFSVIVIVQLDTYHVK